MHELLNRCDCSSNAMKVQNVMVDSPVDTNVVPVGEIDVGNIALDECKPGVFPEKFGDRALPQFDARYPAGFPRIQKVLARDPNVAADIEHGGGRIDVLCDALCTT
jgi:hypothetical protein